METKYTPEIGREAEPKKESIGDRYERLIDETAQLKRKLKKYPIREFDIGLSEELASDEVIKKITEKWLAEVRKGTKLLDLTDRLGINVFVDNLEDQQAFPETKIHFSSDEVLRENVHTLNETEGIADKIRKRIDIVPSKPATRKQLYYFLDSGRIHPAVGTLIHELIHIRHFSLSDSSLEILSEAQAYWSGILDMRSFSIKKTTETMTRGEEEKGLYNFDIDLTLEAMIAMSRLHGLRVSEDKIAELVAQSSYNAKKRRFEPLCDEVDRLAKAYGYDEVDLQALDDLYRLEMQNDKLRARLMLFQIIDAEFTRQQRIKAKLDHLKQGFAEPTYRLNGKPVPARDLCQSFIVPENEKYPYDFDGKRSGIVLGFFPNQEGGEELAYNIGRLEIEQEEGRLSLADNKKQENDYLNDLAQHAENITFEHKLWFTNQCFDLMSNETGDDLRLRVLKALMKQKERIDVMTEIIKTNLRIILEIQWSLQRLKEDLDWVIRGSGKLERVMDDERYDIFKSHEEFITNLKNLIEKLDISIEELDEDEQKLLSDAVNELKGIEEALETIDRSTQSAILAAS